MHQTASRARTAIAVLVLAAGVLVGCGSSDDDDAREPSASTASSAADTTTEAEGEGKGEGEGEGEAPADPAEGSEPTGRLLLDGEDYPLTFDADDPNANCQVLAVGAITVSGMRTPSGNQVDITIASIPRPNVMATYYDDDEVTLWSVATDGSSVEPTFEAEGSTASVSGQWFNRQDPSLDEIEGELEVTC